MEVDQLHVDVNIVDGIVLDTEAFKKWKPDYANATFELEDGKYICGVEVEKMSKRWYNVVNPDTIIEKYGADTFRMYEMFLGPLDQFKPWNTSGITGVFGFMRKFWNLFHNADGQFEMSQEAATDAELKVLHKTIKKIEDDYDRLSFNTSVSAFMICVNELNALKCKKSAILLPLCTLLAPYSPHICEEIFELAGQEGSVINAAFPKLEEKYLVESSFDYPVSFNGKVRFKQAFELSSTSADIEDWVRSNEEVSSFLNGNPIKKIIVVHGKIINVVM
jgi:leucyl-tRNA synthetase